MRSTKYDRCSWERIDIRTLLRNGQSNVSLAFNRKSAISWVELLQACSDIRTGSKVPLKLFSEHGLDSPSLIPLLAVSQSCSLFPIPCMKGKKWPTPKVECRILRDGSPLTFKVNMRFGTEPLQIVRDRRSGPEYHWRSSLFDVSVSIRDGLPAYFLASRGSRHNVSFLALILKSLVSIPDFK